MSGLTPESSQGPSAPPHPRSDKDRQLEYKRSRGEVSCAECRRLKLKCDKKNPCSSCIRRHCQAVCPNGTLPSKIEQSGGSDSKLRKKVVQMSRRIRQLEDALKILQARVSSAPHPLLTTNLLEIKTTNSPSDDSEYCSDATDAEICDDFGTLTIADEGMTHFIGRSGADAMIAIAFNESTPEIKRKAYQRLPPEIASLVNSFPFPPINNPKDRIIAAIESRLPSYERATALVEAYLQHISSFFRPVSREQIMEELLPKFFRRSSAGLRVPAAVASPRGGTEIFEHQLALLLAVFACGAVGDLTLEACNEEGETYQELARSALSLHSIFEGTSLATVQAVALIGAYGIFSASAQTIESPFKLLTLALSLGITIGLHWDPSSWNIELRFAQRRRSLFWELYNMEISKSLVSGRPMMLRLGNIDCKLPDDEDARVDEDGTIAQGFWRWKIDFATKIVNVVAQRMCTARPMKYGDIMELDRKIRAHLGIVGAPPELSFPYSTSSLQHLMKVIHFESVVFFLHRNFFIMAIRENAKDPLRSRFASSFLATYSCAITMVAAIRRDFDCSNFLLLRQWTLWVRALGCGVVIGTIAATNTLSDLSQTALQELELVINLFEKAITHPVAKNGLPILWRLRDKAKSNMATGGPENDSDLTSSIQVKSEEVDEALSMIGGTRRLVREARRPFDPLVSDPSASSTFLTIVPPTVLFPPSSTLPDQSAIDARIGIPGMEAEGSSELMEGSQYDSLDWDPLMPSNPHLNNNLADGILGDTNFYPTGDATQTNLRDPSVSMDTNPYDFEYSFGETHLRNTNFFSDMQSSTHSSDVDAMIEDIWRTISEDPRLTDTGINQSSFQL